MKKKILSIVLACARAITAFSGIAFADNSLPFQDVSELHPFFDAISYVYANGIMNGVADDEFAADSSLTRAMIVTILHRTAGEPIVNFAMNFTDVPSGQYYTEAVRWAQAEGVVNGVSETEFAPDMNVTREQLAAIVYRFAVASGVDENSVTADTNTLSYDDIFDVSEWASAAFHFCLAGSILTDRGDGKVYPQADATRGEAANAFMNLAKLLPEKEAGSYDALAGDYQDSASRRATLIASVVGDGLLIQVSWADSAAVSNIWTMNAKYDDNGKLAYNDASLNIYTTVDDKTEEKKEYENGQGYFTVADGKLLWDGAADESCKACVFEKTNGGFAGMPNPMVESSKEEIMNKFGFVMEAPEGVDDPIYYIIDDSLAQLVYGADGAKVTYRIAPATEFTDISGMYYKEGTEQSCQISGRDGKLAEYITEDGQIRICNWFDAAPGLMYSIVIEGENLDFIPLEDVPEFAEMLFVPVQGNAE